MCAPFQKRELNCGKTKKAKLFICYIFTVFKASIFSIVICRWKINATKFVRNEIYERRFVRFSENAFFNWKIDKLKKKWNSQLRKMHINNLWICTVILYIMTEKIKVKVLASIVLFSLQFRLVQKNRCF